jgi:acetylornithine/N-succinyldiaminopimelate aminotransferase
MTIMASPLMSAYKALPISFSYGKGAWLYDNTGDAYLDALTGIAVCGLGHAHPKVTATITAQAQKLLHTSNGYHIENQERLATCLTKLSGMDNAFFVNSGAEANETALKLCRLWGREKNISLPHIIVTERGFHGRTLATLSASGSREIQAGFEPLVQGFIRVPFNDVAAIRTVLESRNDVVAIMVEPIQGNGGVRIPDEDYLVQLRQLCDAHDCLLVLDEIQTGIGRTGKWFAYQHTPIMPDILTSAKALGNGIPIGACLAKGRASELFHPGQHGSTYGGNPFASAVALTVLETIQEENLLPHIAKMGELLQHRLNETLQAYPKVKSIRSKGLILGVELSASGPTLPAIGLKERLLFNVTAENVIRILPPYIINADEIEQIVTRLQKVIAQF